MRGIEGGFDIGGAGAGDLAEDLAGDGGDVVEIFAGERSDPAAADVVVVLLAESDGMFAAGSEGGDGGHGCAPVTAGSRLVRAVGARGGAWGAAREL